MGEARRREEKEDGERVKGKEDPVRSSKKKRKRKRGVRLE